MSNIQKPNLQMNYFESENIVHILIAEGKEAGSVEVSPNITAELNEKGELIGVEILKVSAYIQDSISESVQGKLLSLVQPQT